MPEPISALVLPFGMAAMYALTRPSSAVSAESAAVQVQATGILTRIERSDALFGREAAVISELIELAITHGSHGWDGDQAAAVDHASIALAIAFVRAAPAFLRQPEVGVDPDGSVTLDWLISRRRMLSISFIGETGRLAYAWLDGGDRGHATAYFDGRDVPRRVLDTVRGFAGLTSDVGLRAA